MKVKFLTNCSPGIEQQRRTDAHFEAASAYWSQVYESADAEAAICKNRRFAVLEMVRKLNVSTERPVLEIGCGATDSPVWRWLNSAIRFKPSIRWRP